jgi:NtrC-family two-component system sensor histidine kinase KinB
MESQTAGPLASPPPNNAFQHQARLYTIIHELNSLVGQKSSQVARSFFVSLTQTTGATSGRLFLVNEKGKPEYCLVLADGQMEEYDARSSPPLEEQALAGWIYRQRRGTLIADIASAPHWLSWDPTLAAFPTGSALAVPLLIADRPLGAVALIAAQPHHFTETDLAIITNLAGQTAVIIENTRLSNLTAQKQNTINALRQTTHTISTSLDLDQSLRAILSQLVQVVPHQYAMVLLREGRHIRPAAMTGFANAEELVQRTFTSADIPTVFHALNQGHVIVADSQDRLADLANLPFPQPLHAGAIAPLLTRGETMGAVVLGSLAPFVFDDQTIPTINAFADHLAIAVANHRLAQEKDRRLRELAYLNETGQAIISTLNLDRVLHLLLERVRALLQVDAASIALRDEQTGNLVFEAASGAGATGVLGVQLQPGQGIAGWVAETGKPLIVQDAYSDTRFFAEVDRKTGMRTEAILCLPIVLKGHVVGVIEALNPGPLPFDEHAVELLNALAGLAATAIDNARLFAQVRSAEARYEGLFEDSANPIIITDLRGTIIEVNRNACVLLGQSKDALCGTSLSAIHSAEGRADLMRALEQIQAGEDVVFQSAIPGDAQRRTVEIKGKKILVRGTPLIQWIGRDISAEIGLEQAREDMVRMIIHDLRNPLSNIMNSLDVLQDVIREQDDSVSRDELLGIAKRSGQRMLQLINSILDISRLETGQAVLETRPTDLAPLLQDAIEFIRPQTDIRDIQLDAELTPNLPQVDIDRDMIARVVLNLLDNASKFTQIGGAIRLTAIPVGSEIEIAVTDNGPGIPLGQLQSIFEKFTRVRRPDSPQGTGLGLAFCQLAVKNHGGRIWAESMPGQGTAIRFTLPVAAAPSSG